MPAQTIQRPRSQLLLCVLCLISLHLIFPAPDPLVLAQVFPFDVYIVFSNGVDTGIHSRPVDCHAQCGYVAPHAHFTSYCASLVPDVQSKREARQVIFPARILQRVADEFQCVKQGFAVERIWLACRIFKITKHPDSLLPQNVLCRFSCCARFSFLVAGDRCRCHFSEHGYIPQGVNDVLQRVGINPVVIVRLCDLHPPHDAFSWVFVVLQPVSDLHFRAVNGPCDGRCALPFQDVQPAGFRPELFRRCQCMSV